MEGQREGGLGYQSKLAPSQERGSGRLDALRNALALPTTLKELTSEIRRFNQNLEELNVDPTTVKDVVEVAKDIRKMLAGMLGYKVRKPVAQIPPSKAV